MLAARTIRYFKLSVLFLISATIAFLCIAIGRVASALSYIAAAIFWLSIILQQGFFWLGNAGRKKMERKGFRMRRFSNQGPGILNFFSNRVAAKWDMVMVISLVAVILEITFSVKSKWLIMFSLTLLFLSFNLHCILNGTNYKYLTAYIKHKKRSKGKHE